MCSEEINSHVHLQMFFAGNIGARDNDNDNVYNGFILLLPLPSRLPEKENITLSDISSNLLTNHHTCHMHVIQYSLATRNMSTPDRILNRILI